MFVSFRLSLRLFCALNCATKRHYNKCAGALKALLRQLSSCTRDKIPPTQKHSKEIPLPKLFWQHGMIRESLFLMCFEVCFDQNVAEVLCKSELNLRFWMAGCCIWVLMKLLLLFWWRPSIVWERVVQLTQIVCHLGCRAQSNNRAAVMHFWWLNVLGMPLP